MRPLASPSLDHLVGAGEEKGRHLGAKRLGRPHIDNKLVFRWGLHGQIGRLLAVENAVNVGSSAAELVGSISTVGRQPANGDKGLGVVEGRQLVLGRQPNNHVPKTHGEPTGGAISPPLPERAKAATARSRSGTSCKLIGLTSRPKVGEASWMALHWPAPAVIAGSRTTPTRVTPDATSLSSSSHFPPIPYSNAMRQVEQGQRGWRPDPRQAGRVVGEHRSRR